MSESLSSRHNVPSKDQYELNKSEVRWFFKDTGDKQWTAFTGYDSLRIEENYAELSHVNKETLDCSSRNKKSRRKLSVTEESLEREAGKLVVRSGLFEVDVLQQTCVSIFGSGDIVLVTRGSWFLEKSWQPVDKELSEHLESVHVQLFHGKEYVNSDEEVIHIEEMSDYVVHWYSPNKVYLFSVPSSSKLSRFITGQFTSYLQRNMGSSLRRGFKHSATTSDTPKEINQLVFVVHGIGKKHTNMITGKNILECTNLMRDSVETLQNQFFPNSKVSAAFVPVDWRTLLTLSEELLDIITPANSFVRDFVKQSAMDVLYYNSPLYNMKVQQAVTNELNRLYQLFMRKNPSSKAKASIVAHSFGCVIVHDILNGWLSYKPVHNNETIFKTNKTLAFHVDNLFCLGSPLAVFLALRVPREQQGFHLFSSLCNRIYNIFYMTDAIAYRLEPLIFSGFTNVAPERIKDPHEVHYIRHSDTILPKSTDSPENLTIEPTPSTSQEYSEMSQHISSKEISNRVDFALDPPPVGIFDGLTVLFLALKSHPEYWDNSCLSYFILTHLFPNLLESRD